MALELGGNAGCIVHSDADLEKAVACTTGGFAYAGQSCISVQRILVERSVFKPFLEKISTAMQKLRLGDPSDELTDVGPMIRVSDAERAELWRSRCAGAEWSAAGNNTALQGGADQGR